jgi:PAS domain-containing protein
MEISKGIPERIEIFDALPFGLLLVNKNLQIVKSNKRFINLYGLLEGKYLFETGGNISKPEIISRIEEVFETGVDSSAIITGVDNNNKFSIMIANIYPIWDKDGELGNVLISLNEKQNNNNFYNDFTLLFESVPAFIAIVDKDLKIIRANQKYRDTFGDSFSIFYSDPNRKKNAYHTSATYLTFQDNQEHNDTFLANSKNGERIQLMVTSLPYTIQDNTTHLVMEILTDISEINFLQDQLRTAHDFYTDLIESSADGIIAIDLKRRVQIFNQTAAKMINWTGQRKPSIPKIQEILPEEFWSGADENGNIIIDCECIIKTVENKSVPVRFNAFEIKNKKKVMGRVAFFQDLRNIRLLEKQKNDARKDALLTTLKLFESNIENIIEEQFNIYNQFEERLKHSSPQTVEHNWMMHKYHLNFIGNLLRNYIKIAKGYTKNTAIFNLYLLSDSIYKEILPFAKFNNVELSFKYLINDNIINFDEFATKIIITILLMNGIDSSKESNINPKVDLIIEQSEENNKIIVYDNGPDLNSKINSNINDNQINLHEKQIGLLTLVLLSNILGTKFETEYSAENGNKLSIII